MTMNNEADFFDELLRDSDGEYFDTIASNISWNWS